MKIDTRAFLDLCGLECTKADFNEASGAFGFQPARIAFATARNIEDLKALPSAPGAQLSSIRFGDALLVWTDLEGKKRGMRVDAGKDAAVQLKLTSDGKTTLLPFTGVSMLSAREKLLTTDPGKLTSDQRKALEGIQGVLDIIMANPDPVRFSPDVIGNAFASAMIDAMGRPVLPVTAEEFGRKARADLLRVKISRIDPENPDGFGPLRPLQKILDDFGIGGFGSPNFRVNGAFVNEPTLRRIVSSNRDLSTKVFGAMTATPPSRLSAAAMSSDDFQNLCGGLSRHKITGSWIEMAGNRITQIMQAAVPGYGCEIAAFAIDNRDLIAFREIIRGEPGVCYAYSWPSMDRLPSASVDDVIQVNISPEEIPDETEIRRLQGVLDIASYSATAEFDIDLDGISIQSRGLRRP